MSRKGRGYHRPRDPDPEYTPRPAATPEPAADDCDTYAGQYYAIEWSSEFARDSDDPDQYSKRQPPFSRGKLLDIIGTYFLFGGTDADHDEIWVRAEDIWSMTRIQ